MRVGKTLRIVRSLRFKEGKKEGRGRARSFPSTIDQRSTSFLPSSPTRMGRRTSSFARRTRSPSPFNEPSSSHTPQSSKISSPSLNLHQRKDRRRRPRRSSPSSTSPRSQSRSPSSFATSSQNPTSSTASLPGSQRSQP